MAEEMEIWFGAKTLYAHEQLSREGGKTCFEERVVLLRAPNEDEAIRQAEEEARSYASGPGGSRYLGYVNVFRIDGDAPDVGTEVFSIMRSMELSSEDFITRYYDDGSFHTR
jgi:hypothetical protein